MALHIITGPPAGGKSTFVQDNAQPGDIRIDLDHLANHLAGLPANGHEHDSRVWAVAKAARTAAIDTALKHSTDIDVWIIDSKPTGKNMTKYQQHDAQIHLIDPGKEVVMSRCKRQRPTGTTKIAGMWYAQQAKQLTIKSFAYGQQHPKGFILDARDLPNPYQVAALRAPDGTSRRVGNWLNQQPEVHHFIDHAIKRIDREQPTEVWIGCSAGKHRSVYIAEQLADHYNTTATHTALPPKRDKTSTELGLGWEHQKQRRRLIAKLKDGEPCWWCDQPMFKKPEHNFDQAPLEADHSLSRRDHGNQHVADRLLHRTCNRQRGAGDHDHIRPAVTGKPFTHSPDPEVMPEQRPAFSW